MAKIAFDKYYTPPIVAKWCIEKTKEIIGEENITEWVEPSAGSGSFSHQIPGCKAYDLYPQHEYIEQADFLKLDLGGYKKGRCFIGNHPFGAGAGKIIKDFYNKACDNGDYIAFIQPPAFYKNYSRFYRFEIVYSCLLKANYTNHELYTSFTIYKRNPDKDDWRPKYEKLKDITLTRVSRSNKKGEHLKNIDYDICITIFGNVFKETKPYETAGQIAVKCNNPDNKEEILKCIKWLYHHNKETQFLSKKCISTNNCTVTDFEELLRLCIPGIK
jgi:hypothetical protein